MRNNLEGEIVNDIAHAKQLFPVAPMPSGAQLQGVHATTMPTPPPPYNGLIKAGGGGGGGAGGALPATVVPVSPHGQGHIVEHNAVQERDDTGLHATPKTRCGGRDAASAAAHQADDSNLIVNYIPAEVSDEELKQLFEQYGPVSSAKIIRDAQGCTKGYGFIKFDAVDDAQRCLQSMNGFEIHGKRLRVNIARPTNGVQQYNHPQFKQNQQTRQGTTAKHGQAPAYSQVLASPSLSAQPPPPPHHHHHFIAHPHAPPAVQPPPPPHHSAFLVHQQLYQQQQQQQQVAWFTSPHPSPHSVMHGVLMQPTSVATPPYQQQTLGHNLLSPNAPPLRNATAAPPHLQLPMAAHGGGGGNAAPQIVLMPAPMTQPALNPGADRRSSIDSLTSDGTASLLTSPTAGARGGPSGVNRSGVVVVPPPAFSVQVQAARDAQQRW